ncbi:MAG: J domain-containing protein [Acidimicrobiia bacterium]|nr:J domain-containing protein [Acidimicrobiia bacterium]
MSHYDVLGVSRDADRSDMRRAFLNLARLNHPDTLGDADETARRQAADRMAALNEAYNVLTDERKRRRYDRDLVVKEADEALRRRGAGPRAWDRPGAAPAGTAGGNPVGDLDSGIQALRDWRSFASPGPATTRPFGARVPAIAPAVLLMTSIAVLGLGAMFRSQMFVSLATVIAALSAIAFIAAPLLAMRESSRSASSQGSLGGGARPSPAAASGHRRSDDPTAE